MEQYQQSATPEKNILEYKKIIRASVLWMSFSEYIQFNDVKFLKLDALMSTDANQPQGN